MDLKKRVVRRVGGSLMVAIDPDFAREVGIDDGTEVFAISDRRFMLLTHDEIEAKSISEELHAHTRKFLRARVAQSEANP